MSISSKFDIFFFASLLAQTWRLLLKKVEAVWKKGCQLQTQKLVSVLTEFCSDWFDLEVLHVQ